MIPSAELVWSGAEECSALREWQSQTHFLSVCWVECSRSGIIMIYNLSVSEDSVSCSLGQVNPIQD